MSLSTNEIIILYCELFKNVFNRIRWYANIVSAHLYISVVRMFGMHILNWRNWQRAERSEEVTCATYMHANAVIYRNNDSSLCSYSVF